MKLLIASFLLAMLSAAGASIGLAIWDGRFHHDTVRAIHYDTKYDLSSQRRMPAEPLR